MIGVVISSDGFKVKMKRILAQAKNPRSIMNRVGREGATQLRNHFRRKNLNSANKLGGKRRNFWRQVMQSVSAPVVTSSGRTVVISITDPAFAQKVFGGTITAKRAHALTIPVTSEAYGLAASSFEIKHGVKLFVIGREFGKGMLAAQIGNTVKVHYLLRKSVTQQPDPDALPNQQQLEDAVTAKAQEVLDRQLKGGTQ